MIHGQTIDETLKSILKLVDPNKYHSNSERIIKLILENLVLSAKLELMKELNEGR